MAAPSPESAIEDTSGSCRLVTWNINALMPTLANVRLRHGSMLGFLDFLEADILCLQVCCSPGCLPSLTFAALKTACLQETKLTASKLTREVVCLGDGVEVRSHAAPQPPMLPVH